MARGRPRRSGPLLESGEYRRKSTAKRGRPRKSGNGMSAEEYASRAEEAAKILGGTKGTRKSASQVKTDLRQGIKGMKTRLKDAKKKLRQVVKDL